MATGVFNIAKGRVNELVSRIANNDPANSALIVVLLKVAEVDATLKDYDTLAAVLAGANTEADFTNYARKVLTDLDLSSPTPDDANDKMNSAMGNIIWTAAGGTLDNTLVKLLVCYDSDTTAGTDANIVPLCFYDFATTTNGADLQATEHADGFYTAGE